MLKDKEPGSFIVRDSHSFRGAYGLAVKVATPPPSVLQLNRKGRRPGPCRVCQLVGRRSPTPSRGGVPGLCPKHCPRSRRVFAVCQFYFFVALNG